ncbi:hypothetical protein ABE042_20245 [Viridibacillus arvi]|uniref:hypothetical protein n=1 Tax=Viridibacillus arvi TaxID=263475 RepID=UPI003D285D62
MECEFNSWTSSTPSTNPGKVVRGSSTDISSWSYSPNNTSTNVKAFRPVLEIESLITIQKKSIIYHDGQYKSYTQESWKNVSTILPTLEQFLKYGMDLIPAGKLSLLGNENNLKIATWLSDENYAPIVKVTAIPHNQIVFSTKDINIKSVENIDSITMTVDERGKGNLRTIVSFDEGATWYTHYGSEWITVAEDADEAIANGMSEKQLSALTSEQWSKLRGQSNTLRFAYALSIEDTTDVAEIDALTTQMDMKGTWKKAVHDKEYSYEYPYNDELLVTIYADGDYKINY